LRAVIFPPQGFFWIRRLVTKGVDVGRSDHRKPRVRSKESLKMVEHRTIALESIRPHFLFDEIEIVGNGGLDCHSPLSRSRNIAVFIENCATDELELFAALCLQSVGRRGSGLCSSVSFLRATQLKLVGLTLDQR
jgi:hypothetical protein